MAKRHGFRCDDWEYVWTLIYLCFYRCNSRFRSLSHVFGFSINNSWTSVFFCARNKDILRMREKAVFCTFIYVFTISFVSFHQNIKIWGVFTQIQIDEFWDSVWKIQLDGIRNLCGRNPIGCILKICVEKSSWLDSKILRLKTVWQEFQNSALNYMLRSSLSWLLI